MLTFLFLFFLSTFTLSAVHNESNYQYWKTPHVSIAMIEDILYSPQGNVNMRVAKSNSLLNWLCSNYQILSKIDKKKFPTLVNLFINKKINKIGLSYKPIRLYYIACVNYFAFIIKY